MAALVIEYIARDVSKRVCYEPLKKGRSFSGQGFKEEKGR